MSVKELVSHLASKYKTKIGEFTDDSMDVTVYLVDGEYVRNNLDVSFIGGGHGYIYKYVPKNEIWIEKIQSPQDICCLLIHEITERIYMKIDGMKYEPAHKIANSIEDMVRSIYKMKMPK